MAATVLHAHPVQRVLAWWRCDPGAHLSLTLLVALRLSLGLAGVLSLRFVAADRISYPLPDEELIRDDTLPSALLSMWQRWDATWYQRIAESGYVAGDGGVHFGPLYPPIAKGVSVVLGGHMVISELLVASVAYAVALYLLYHLVIRDVDADTARLTVLLIALFPSGFFLLAPYTEGLYLALSIAAIQLARVGRPWWAGVAAYAAVLTRTIGVVLVLPLAFEHIRRHRACVRGSLKDLAATALPVLGVIATVAFQRFVVGDPATPLDLSWQGDSAHVPIWQALADSWNFVRSTGDPIEALNLVCLLGSIGLAVLLVKYRQPFAYVLYALLYLTLAGSREWGTGLGGMNRVVLVLFPCFTALSIWLGRHPRLAAAWLLISAQLQIVLLVEFVHWGFVA